MLWKLPVLRRYFYSSSFKAIAVAYFFPSCDMKLHFRNDFVIHLLHNFAISEFLYLKRPAASF